LDKVYPERTYAGRDRISLAPRWVSNWIITGAVIYFMGSYAARFMGFQTGFDPFMKGSPSAVAVLTSTPLPNYPLNNQGSFHASSDPNSPVSVTPVLSGGLPAVAVAQIQPTFTPFPTYTPYPTQRPIFGEVLAVGYSYYWPPFGPPNCGPENWHADINYCDDMTASGLKWSQYIGVGVAVPVQWREDIPLGSTIRVRSPKEMIGDYIVLDYCGGCIKPEGHVYFDFLDNRMRLAWTVPLLVEVIKK
jgi:hypothetical protein